MLLKVVPFTNDYGDASVVDVIGTVHSELRLGPQFVAPMQAVHSPYLHPHGPRVGPLVFDIFSSADDNLKLILLHAPAFHLPGAYHHVQAMVDLSANSNRTLSAANLIVNSLHSLTNMLYVGLAVLVVLLLLSAFCALLAFFLLPARLHQMVHDSARAAHYTAEVQDNYGSHLRSFFVRTGELVINAVHDLDAMRAQGVCLQSAQVATLKDATGRLGESADLLRQLDLAEPELLSAGAKASLSVICACAQDLQRLVVEIGEIFVEVDLERAQPVDQILGARGARPTSGA
jgi:hypothetical protein